MKKQLSFIIPVYNSEKYIRKCVESITSQTDRDFELILVNDGSKDNSGIICNDMAKEDKRIKVIHQENKGICGARDTGIREAVGEWLCFVDNDDIIASGSVECIFESMDKENDIIYFGFDEFRNEESIVENEGTLLENTYENKEIEKLQWDCLCRYRDNKPLINIRLLTTPWGKIYRRDFLVENNLMFIEGMKREEDVSFNLMCLACCKKVKYIDRIIYHYRLSISSESHSYKTNIINEAKQALNYYREIIDKYYVGRTDIEELYEYRILWELLYCVVLDSAHVNNPKKYSQKKKEFNELLDIQLFKKAIDESDISRLSKQHRILAKCIKMRSYFSVYVLSKLENVYHKVKYR